MHDPGKEHWQVVNQEENRGVVGYCDSDYAGDLNKRWSTTGYLFTLAKAQVNQKSTLQSTIVLSSTEAECMTITKAIKQAIWLQGLLGELEIKQKYDKVHCDSQSAIQLAKNQVYHARTKHVDVQYHFGQEVLTFQLQHSFSLKLFIFDHAT